MRNYLRAEFYKVVRRKYLWITLAVALGMETFLFVGYALFHGDQAGMGFHTGWTNLIGLLSLGIPAILLTGDMVFANQNKNGTLKNELSYGLSRGKVYWGKLLAQTGLSLLLCGVMLGYYLAGCWLLLSHDPVLDAWAMAQVGWTLLAALPLWLSAQALCCCMYFLLPSDLTGGMTALACLYGLPLMALIFGGLGGGNPISGLLEWAYRLMPVTMLEQVINQRVGSGLTLALTWGTGAAWWGGWTALGLLGFRHKEIR
ncbi:MAG TPA: ABC transporter permease [Candidatus Enterenecus merdae]|nr:ABC transporter permease [Candidatus Enterenecus merdae]